MEKIKTLTVGTDTYQLCDPEAARVDDMAVGDTVWSSRKLVECLCPGFEKTGDVVTCTPLAGTEVSVISHIQQETSGIQLQISGKNMLDITTMLYGNVENAAVQKEPNAITLTATNQARSQWRGLLNISPQLWGKQLTLSCGEWHCTDSTADPRLLVYQHISATQSIAEHGVGLKQKNSLTFTVKENVTYLMIVFRMDQTAPYSPVGSVLSVQNIQLEVGDQATAFEPCRENRILSTNFDKNVAFGSYHWNTGLLIEADGQTTQLTPCGLIAQPGTTMFVGDRLTVTGRSDLSELLKAHGIQ